MKWYKLAYRLFPLIVLAFFWGLYLSTQNSPAGPLTKDYIQSLSLTGGCEGASQTFCNFMIGFMRMADTLGGGIPTAQLLWFGPGALLLLWFFAPKPARMIETNIITLPDGTYQVIQKEEDQ